MHILCLATTTFSLETSTSQAVGQQTSAVAVGSGNSNSASNTSSNQGKSSINIGAIVGGIVCGVFVVLLGVFIWWYMRRHPRHPKRNENDSYPVPKNKHRKINPNPNPEPMPTLTPAPYPAPLPYPQPLPYPHPVPTPDRNVTNAPPDYESVHGHRIDNVLPVNPAPVPGTNEEPQDDLRRFADRHRSHISPVLEDKLRVAHYRPDDDPSSVPESVWAERYNVGIFELRRLQEVYNRRA
jgi:hypothetical protein